MFLPDKLFMRSMKFVDRARSLPYSVASESCVHLGRLFPANIRLGWKDLTGTNTFAFCKNVYITDINFLSKWPQIVIVPRIPRKL